jgi:hypothetical protein
MAGKGSGWAAAVLLAWLVQPAPARAGWLYEWCHCCCPSYHKWNYNAPEIDRFWAFYCHYPRTYTYAKDLHPDVPLYFQPVAYPCRPVPPGIYTRTNYPWFPQLDGWPTFIPRDRPTAATQQRLE